MVTRTTPGHRPPAPARPRQPTASDRRPRLVPPSAARALGPASICLLVVAQAALWVVARPEGERARSYAGQLIGAEAVLLLSIALVLVSTLPWVEPWFDGIDRAAIWHRRVAITGLLLLLPHVALSTNPRPSSTGPTLAAIGTLGLATLAVWAILPRWRSVVPAPLRRAIVAVRRARPVGWLHQHVFGGYERWRALHRTTGLFVAAGFAHGLLDGTPFHSGALRWSYVAVGGIGLAFYVYRELLARHFVPLHDYEVETVREVSTGLVEIALRRLGKRFEFAPGQFAVVYLEAKDGWHRHPFTISSAPPERTVRITVKALGDYTSSIAESIEPGMPAVIGAAHGRFDHHRGTERQAWIAGGVGVTPFLSWLRTAAGDDDLPQRVDFFYSTEGAAPFADEIREIAARRKSLRVHIVDTAAEGRLTPERVLAACDDDPRILSAFMCGPEGMLRTFQTALRAAGVSARHIHREHFDWR